MIATASVCNGGKPRRNGPKSKVTSRHQQAFLELLPAIHTHAKICFRALKPEVREEMIQEVLARAWQAYVRLIEQGKEDLAYAGPLARYAVSQARAGRCVGGKLNVRDVSSVHCQRTKKVFIGRLLRYDHQKQSWQEFLVEDRKATPADVAAIRIDFAAWLQRLQKRNRRIALELAAGRTTTEVSRRFKLAPGRISQLRRELHRSWAHFQGSTV